MDVMGDFAHAVVLSEHTACAKLVPAEAGIAPAVEARGEMIE
jgi:hypothetical protein